MSKTWRITLEVDQAWFKAIDELTSDVHEGEVCTWIKAEEIH